MCIRDRQYARLSDALGNFREETLLELAESIRQSGVLQPICVRPRDEGFEIVYGERRYWAAAMAGLQFIPALIRELSDAEAEDAAITENLQREDVRPREEAAAYKRALQSGRHTICLLYTSRCV